ncbi:MAG: T9SS type A sorting domain-containing protein, partial [Bacteroidales bacterium]|nr:T9SS type A sorting domain-containing protein [Candidatus Colimorpha merdihippi]MBQ0161189.1 T9SS type A sorting domain-containing protein [Candidatus Colimorpha merdihippi]
DMSGRVVYSQNMNAESAQVISLNNLAKGAYFVRITNDKFSKIEKLIVR